MRKLLLVLPLLVCSPSCKGLDRALGLGDAEEPDKSEEVISGIEGTVAPIANTLLPWGGGALALALGQLARVYIKKRKAAAATA